MTQNISITIPLECNALLQTAEYFKLLAGGLAPTVVEEIQVPTQVQEVQVPEQVEDADTSWDAVNAASYEAPTVPTAPTPTPAAPAQPTGVTLDARGLPWDARIHAGSQKFIADGTWRMKRGVEDELVAQVEAELFALMGAVPVVTVAPTQTAPVTPTAPTPAAPVTPVPAAPTAAPATSVPAAPTTAIKTFPELMRAVSSGVALGIFTVERVTEVINALGIETLPMIGSRPDLIPTVVAELGL